MSCDQEKFDKACPETTDLIFFYEGKNAVLEICKEVCLKDKRCVAVSGRFAGREESRWCIGCRIELVDDVTESVAFKKQELEEEGKEPLNL